jgi:hypothetical protein
MSGIRSRERGPLIGLGVVLIYSHHSSLSGFHHLFLQVFFRRIRGVPNVGRDHEMKIDMIESSGFMAFHR